MTSGHQFTGIKDEKSCLLQDPGSRPNNTGLHANYPFPSGNFRRYRLKSLPLPPTSPILFPQAQKMDYEHHFHGMLRHHVSKRASSPINHAPQMIQSSTCMPQNVIFLHPEVHSFGWRTPCTPSICSNCLPPEMIASSISLHLNGGICYSVFSYLLYKNYPQSLFE